MHTHRAAAAAFAVALLAAAAQAGSDAARDLQSKDPVVRLAAVDAAVREGGKEAEALLVAALANDDWEVAERAAAGLATRGTPATAPKLVAVALTGPIRRVRLAAARSAVKLDADRTIALLGKAAAGEDAVRAFEALTAIGESGPNAPAAGIVDLGLDASRARPRAASRESVRAAAAAALGTFGRAGRNERIARLIPDDDPAVACAALDAAAASPDIAVLGTLVDSLGRPGVHECVERRLRNAFRAAIAGRPRGSDAAAAARPLFDRLAAAPTPETARRIVGVLGALAAPSSSESETDADLVAAAVQTLTAAATHADAGVRAAAAAALGGSRSPAAAPALVRLAESDADAHVRLVAVAALADCAAPGDADALVAFIDRLRDGDAQVREEAAVALGRENAPDAVAPLARTVTAVLADPARADVLVASAALVSLGRTRDPAALPALRAALHDPDWRLRASAAAGLGRLRLPAVVPDLLDALDDKSPSVRATALETLVDAAGRDGGTDAKSWRAWWKAHEKGFFFPDHAAALREARMYGWAETASGVWEDLDVILLRGASGDDAHEVLDLNGISYRVCKPGQLAAAGVHPGAVVVGFAGDVAGADVDALEWFVHSGGLLAAGAAPLERVLGRGSPGCLRSAGTGDGLVPVSPCAPASPLLSGVFDGGVRPVRRVGPRSFVEVLDPDRVQVAIDSPPSAASFGAADVACWLRCGHGVALELGGGIDVMGREYFAGTTKADERAAIAVDRMGVGYIELRRMRERKVFENAERCAAEVADLSSFRFVTNFVRAKRRAE
jgi:HEAT repeat protein